MKNYFIILIVFLIIAESLFLTVRFIIIKNNKRNKSSVYRLYKEDKYEQSISLLEDGMADDINLVKRLMEYFEKEKPYLNRNIKINDVSRMIYTNTSYLSRILNQRISKNFNQFVNYYRVKDVCKRFLDKPESNIWEIGESCGFNNNASFTSAFKYHTGYTPAMWCREIKGRLIKKEKICLGEYVK